MKVQYRRKIIKGIALSIPAVWTKPIVNSVILPAHAQTTEDDTDNAPAGPITVRWTLEGVTLNLGGTVNGSFDYTADTNTFTNISMVVAGSPANDGTYTVLADGAFNRIAAALPTAIPGNLVGERVVFLIFLPPRLTNAGGTVLISPPQGAAIATCINAGCTSLATVNAITGGAVLGVPI